MIKTDLHMHTNFCDGKNTPEEMILSAIDKGLENVGICVHGYTDFDNTFCIKKEQVAIFQQQLKGLKEKYQDKINVLCGVEQDFDSNTATGGYDYVIGSVHYLKKGDIYYSVDDNPDKFAEMVNEAFKGDYYLMAEKYFVKVANIVQKAGADIIGHFDLVSKFNQNGEFFDSHNPRYVNAWKSAVDTLIPTGKPFEINLGAIARGYKKEPYPSLEMIDYIKERGGKFIFSSDAHNINNVAFRFKENEYLIK